MTIGIDEAELAAIRRELHSIPELSRSEAMTSSKVTELLRESSPDDLVTGLGGYGVAATYRGPAQGRCIMFRCDMDALPLDESMDIPHRSTSPGVSHKCGHDGHMAIMLGLSRVLAGGKLRRGSVTLLFQPGEETGRGAMDVINDSRFNAIRPGMVFALHNLPGFPEGSVIVSEGTFASASVGMIIRLKGTSSHAAEPHLGRSPAAAVAHIVLALNGLPQAESAMHDGCKATVIHASVGEEAFGTSPGSGVVMATLRTYREALMEKLRGRAGRLAESIAASFGLECTIEWTEEFPATVNSPKAVSVVRKAASTLGMTIIEPAAPFPWSEDFGHFTSSFPGALLGLGAGTDHPALHSPGYDFPDPLLPSGVALFARIIEEIQSEGT